LIGIDGSFRSDLLTNGSTSGLELAGLLDPNLFAGFTALGAVGLNLLDHIHAFHYSAEDYMFAVEPRGLHCCQKELGTVGVRARVGHRENAGSGVFESEVLIGKLSAVYRLSSGAVVVGEVATLAHEVRDHPVECRPPEAEPLLSRTQRPEVFGRFWRHI